MDVWKVFSPDGQALAITQYLADTLNRGGLTSGQELTVPAPRDPTTIPAPRYR